MPAETALDGFAAALGLTATIDQLGISEEDWNQTPASVRTALMFLIQQNQRLENRCATYQLQVQRLEAEMERLKKLRLQREATQKTEAVVQPSVQVSETTNLDSAQRTSSRTRTQASEAQPKTLSEWIERQEREGGRY